MLMMFADFVCLGTGVLFRDLCGRVEGFLDIEMRSGWAVNQCSEG